MQLVNKFLSLVRNTNSNKSRFDNSNIIVNDNKILIGKGTSIGKNVTLWADGESIIIGDNCTLHPYAYLRLHGGKITIGNHVFINPFSVLYGHGGLIIGNNVLIAAHVVIIPASHNYRKKNMTVIDQGETIKGIVIQDDVWIGAGAKILDGVTISKGCVIGSGSVVNKSTKAYGIYVGTPAKLINTRR